MTAYVLKIRELLEDKNIEHKDFADLLNKSRQTVSNYLNGKTKIDIDTFLEIAKVLNVPVGYFFEEVDLTKKIIGDNNIYSEGTQNAVGNNYANCDKYVQEIKGLKEQLKLKDKIINLLENK